MNTDTGRIYNPEDIEEMRKAFGQADLSRMKQMNLPPTQQQMKRRPPKVGRNDPCPCGSGEKFKKCCLTGNHPMAYS